MNAKSMRKRIDPTGVVAGSDFRERAVGMNAQGTRTHQDLVVLVADTTMRVVMEELLKRPTSLGIRTLNFDLFVHPGRDPGCFNEAAEFLRPRSNEYQYALVLFDHEGCGHDDWLPSALADNVKDRLEKNGWPGRADAIVLSPELEVWAWTGSSHVERCLGWRGQTPALRVWLEQKGYWPSTDPKPNRPKEAFEAALRKVQKPRSSTIYGDLARSVSLANHTEPAFVRLTDDLRAWFGNIGARLA